MQNGATTLEAPEKRQEEEMLPHLRARTPREEVTCFTYVNISHAGRKTCTRLFISLQKQKGTEEKNNPKCFLIIIRRRE
jgi:hypothetical protein